MLRALFVSLLLWLSPMTALAQERAVFQYDTLHLPSLLPPLTLPEVLVASLGRPAPPPSRPRYMLRLQRRNSWRMISAGTLLVGTTTLLIGVRLFNNGNNAKKNAAGDTLINIGIGVDLAAILPAGVAFYWGRRRLRP